MRADQEGTILAINIEQLYTKYGPMVLRRCRSLLKDEDLALDAMQDVFVKVLSKKDVLKDSYPSSLLYTIATNHCLNIIRKEKRMTTGEDILDNIAGTDYLEDNAVNKIFLDQIFSSQKESTRTIAVLHYRDGLTLEETAEMTSMSVSGVRRRLRKLREAGFSMEGRSL